MFHVWFGNLKLLELLEFKCLIRLHEQLSLFQTQFFKLINAAFKPQNQHTIFGAVHLGLKSCSNALFQDTKTNKPQLDEATNI